jgi:hypothetical protein
MESLSLQILKQVVAIILLVILGQASLQVRHAWSVHPAVPGQASSSGELVVEMASRLIAS